MIIILALAVCLITVPASALEERHAGEHPPHTEEAHEEHGEEAREISSNVGPGKAVESGDPEKGIQLSSAASQRIDLKTQPLNGNPPFVLPARALIRYRELRAVYRLRDGWITRIEGRANLEGETVHFTPLDERALMAGDAVVVEDVAIVRLAELDAFSTGEEGHGH